MRKHLTCHIVIALLLVCLLSPSTAYPWGSRSMRSVTGMALQVLKHDFPNTFRPGGIVGVNFERDVMAGAAAGWQELVERVPLNNEAEVIQAISNEILLLREARTFGPTSYFAYRMGVLASLTAHAMLPYGFTWTTEEHELRRRIIADIEADIDNFGFSAAQKNRVFIRNISDYFAQRRGFVTEDKRLIAHDYNTGLGYNGFMRQAGRSYFVRAVETVADVWNTVLRADMDDPSFSMSKPSPRTMTWYFVDEIEFLVNEKGNMHQVEKVYSNFQQVNPRLVEAYERLGDILYENEDASIKGRGVVEWQKAYDLGGPERSRIGRNLSGHYLTLGRSFLERAGQPGAEETDLNNALNAFERALDFDRSSDMAAQLIQDTHVAIRDRNERLEMTLNIIATGERIHEEANRYREARDFANAISTYRQSIGFFEAVGEEFRDQVALARQKTSRLRGEITHLLNEVVDAASEAIDEGDRARDRNQFDEAVGFYQRVPGIVSVIPEDASAAFAADRQNLISLAQRKLEEANIARLRYEQAQAELAASGAGQ